MIQYFPNLVILVGVDVPGEPKVRDLERELLPQEAVPCCQVPVGEVSLGEVLHAAGDLQAHPPEVGLERKYATTFSSVQNVFVVAAVFVVVVVATVSVVAVSVAAAVVAAAVSVVTVVDAAAVVATPTPVIVSVVAVVDAAAVVVPVVAAALQFLSLLMLQSSCLLLLLLPQILTILSTGRSSLCSEKTPELDLSTSLRSPKGMNSKTSQGAPEDGSVDTPRQDRMFSWSKEAVIWASR